MSGQADPELLTRAEVLAALRLESDGDGEEEEPPDPLDALVRQGTFPAGIVFVPGTDPVWPRMDVVAFVHLRSRLAGGPR